MTHLLPGEGPPSVLTLVPQRDGCMLWRVGWPWPDGIIGGMKTCSQCGQEFPDTPEFFMPRHLRCKPCYYAHRRAVRAADPEKARAACRAWHAKNAEAVRAKKRAHYEANRDAELARHAAWRKANPETVRAVQHRYHALNREARAAKNRLYRAANIQKERMRRKLYYAAHPEEERLRMNAWVAANRAKTCEATALRRARKAGATEGAEVKREAVWARDGGICHICGQPCDPADWHLDHKIPLSRGGAHSEANVAVSHPICNMKKGNR